MKIVFFGTPDFAVPSLEILLTHGHEICYVVTAPARPSGRGLRVSDSPVKQAAMRHGIPVLQPEKLDDIEFLATIRESRADLFVVVAFRMMPEVLWRLPKSGTFNLHASLLPQYRGAAPINRAIMNGETETGVTTFFLKHEIDTGNIILREKVSILPDETAGELHDRLMLSGADLVLESTRLIASGTVQTLPQEGLLEPGQPLRRAPKIFPPDCRIDWTHTAAIVHNQVRGLSPFPGAFTFFKTGDGVFTKHKIFRTAITGQNPDAKPGAIKVSGSRMFISCSDQELEIIELQQDGRKRLRTGEFVKGFRHEGLFASDAPSMY